MSCCIFRKAMLNVPADKAEETLAKLDKDYGFDETVVNELLTMWFLTLKKMDTQCINTVKF